MPISRDSLKVESRLATVSAALRLFTNTKAGASALRRPASILKLAIACGDVLCSSAIASSASSGCEQVMRTSVFLGASARMASPRPGESQWATSVGFPIVAESPIR